MRVDSERARATRMCSLGCAACGTQLVLVKWVEAIAMVHAYVHAYGADAFLTTIVPKLEAGRELARASTPPGGREPSERKYMEAGLPCAFLSDERTCTIYRDRPLACRALIVLSDPAGCANPAGKIVRANTAAAHERGMREHEIVAREEKQRDAIGVLPDVVLRVAKRMGYDGTPT